MVGSNIVVEIPRRLEQDQPIDDLICNVDVGRFKEIYLEAYYQAVMEKTKPFLNVECTLEKLSLKAALAVITRRNVAEKEVRKELSKFGLSGYFKKILTSRDTCKPKPSPEAFAKCAEYLNVDIRDCAVVGDSVIDIRAGKRAGAQTVAVLTGIFRLKELQNEKPNLILCSVNELPDFLE
jgi:phosphoglycolate phosphatase